MTENEKTNDYIKRVLADGTEFKVIYAGEMIDAKGKPVQWPDSIKLCQGNKQLKISPVALSQLVGIVQQDETVKAVLQARFQAEVKKLQKLQGF